MDGEHKTLVEQDASPHLGNELVAGLRDALTTEHAAIERRKAAEVELFEYFAERVGQYFAISGKVEWCSKYEEEKDTGGSVQPMPEEEREISTTEGIVTDAFYFYNRSWAISFVTEADPEKRWIINLAHIKTVEERPLPDPKHEQQKHVHSELGTMARKVVRWATRKPRQSVKH